MTGCSVVSVLIVASIMLSYSLFSIFSFVLIFMLLSDNDVQRMGFQTRRTTRPVPQSLRRGDVCAAAPLALSPVTTVTLTSPGPPQHPNPPEPRVSHQRGSSAVEENTGLRTCARAGLRDTWRPGGGRRACALQCLQER